MPDPLHAPNVRLVKKVTEVTTPPLCPEIQLHLVTQRCALWRGTDADLDELGLDPPYWAFGWAGGQALARLVLDGRIPVRGRRVLDFGTGSGLVAIAAKMAGADSVLASDLDPLANDATRLNASLNGVELEVTTDDFVDHTDLGVDVVLAGDVTYERPLAERVSAWLLALADRGVDVYVGDPGRGFILSEGFELFETIDAPSDVDVDGKSLVPTRVYSSQSSS